LERGLCFEFDADISLLGLAAGAILKKAEGADTKAELEAALGTPSEVSKVGPIEKWTYKASDGSVIFLITGDYITFEVTGEK
jgi:hypothetical protein